jgi:signal transduction histidine kinase
VSRKLLPNGGELRVQGSLREENSEKYLELKVSSLGDLPCRLKVSNIFRPFLRINGQSIGLSMVLARDILHRHDGKMFFKTESDREAVMTILLPLSVE